MNNTKTLDILQESLFDGTKKNSLTKSQKDMVRRYEAAFTFWLDKPFIKESKIRDYLVNNFKIGTTQAYIDIKNLQYLFGRIKDASKEWHRYKANSIIEEAISLIDSATDKLDLSKANAMIRAAKALVGINKLDQNDMDPLPWDEIIAQKWEPTDDPTAIGLKPIARRELNELKDKLKKKYASEIELNVQDVDYEEQ